MSFFKKTQNNKSPKQKKKQKIVRYYSDIHVQPQVYSDNAIL